MNTTEDGTLPGAILEQQAWQIVQNRKEIIILDQAYTSP
jgi:hypothetical protein